jgi:hypothetical protein
MFDSTLSYRCVRIRTLGYSTLLPYLVLSVGRPIIKKCYHEA